MPSFAEYSVTHEIIKPVFLFIYVFFKPCISQSFKLSRALLRIEL